MSEMELWNNGAEQAILGGLLSDNDGFDRIVHLAPEHFYVGDNQIIFGEMRKQLSAGRRVDAVTLEEVLRNRVPDAMKYLIQLQANSAGAANIKSHADIVLRYAQRRHLARMGAQLLEAAKNSSEDPQVLCGQFAARLDEVARREQATEPKFMADRVEDYRRLAERRIAGLDRRVPTGYRDLDRLLGGGLERGTLTVLGGRPSMGKTALAVGIGHNVSNHGTALFMSMEMPWHSIMDRCVSLHSDIPLTWLRELDKHGGSTHEALDRMAPALRYLSDLRLLMDDETRLSAIDIRSKARQVRRKHGLDLIVIDQLSFITLPQRFDNPSYAVGEITRALVALSKELNCAVLLVAQLNRECEKRPNKRPIMADLALSTSIEQDAATVIFVYRDEVNRKDTPDKGIAELNVAKQRHGAIGTVALEYQEEHTRFVDLDRPWPSARKPTTNPASVTSQTGGLR